MGCGLDIKTAFLNVPLGDVHNKHKRHRISEDEAADPHTEAEDPHRGAEAEGPGGEAVDPRRGVESEDSGGEAGPPRRG